MQCVSCFLRYNAKSRKPTVITCGHTICQDCLGKVSKCRVCNSLIIQNKNYPINYSLMEILEKDTKQIDKYVKVCFVGSSTTGKTSLIKRLIGNAFVENTILTVGYDFCFYDREVNNLQVRYQLWDSAGQERYKAISPIHYKNADIVILVYDMSNSASHNKVSVWLEEAVTNCPQDAKIMIVGNKIDLAQQNQVYRPVDQKAWKSIETSHYTHMEVSCKTAFGLKEFWNAIDSELMKKLSQKKKNLSNFDQELQFAEKKISKMVQIKNKTLSKKVSSSKKPSNSSSCC